MTRYDSRDIRPPDIWMALLLSILLHALIAGVFAFTHSLESPGRQRTLQVNFVTLLGGEALKGNGGEGQDDSSSAGRDSRMGPSGEEPKALRHTAGAEDPEKLQRNKELESHSPPELKPELERHVSPKPLARKPRAKATRKQHDKARDLSGAVHQKKDPRQAEPDKVENRQEAKLPEQSASPGEGLAGSGTRSSGNDAGHGSGSPGIGQGASLPSGPLNARLGSPDGPRFLNRVLPRYPRLARERGKEGSVLLSVTIDPQGHAAHLELLKKAGFGFDDEAMRAVKCSSFAPAKVDGRPVTCKVLLSVRFELKGSDDE